MKKHVLLISVFLVMIAALLTPFFGRYVRGVPPVYDNEPYYHLRMANTLRTTGIPQVDPLLVVPTRYILQFYDIILSTMFLFVNPLYCSILFPVLLGILCFIIFSLMLKDMDIPLMHRVFCLLILSISPPFIVAFTRSSPNAFAIFLNLLGAFLITRKDKHMKLLSILLFSLLPLFGLVHFVIAVAFILFACKHDSKFDFLILLGVLLISFPIILIARPQLHFALSPLDSYFSDLGGLFGIGVWNALLSIVGLAFVWSKKRFLTRFYIFSGIIFIIAIMNQSAMTYLMFVLSIISSFGIIGLFTMRWQLKQVRFLMLLLVSCGLLFSTVSYLNLVVNYGPTKELVESLQWLRNEPASAVFTHPSRGFWVQAFANKPVLSDGVHDSLQVKNDTSTLLYSRNLVLTKNLLHKYNISHIIVDSEMSNGIVWDVPDEGLMFLLGNNETFKRVYSKSGVLVWQVIS